MNGSLQEKHGKYYAVFSYKDENGKRKTEWVNTEIPTTKGNKREAERRLAEIILEREERLKAHSECGSMPFTDYIDLWLEKAKDSVDIITYNGYKSFAVNHIRPYFAKLKFRLGDVTTADIEKYYAYKAVSGRLDGKPGGLSRRSIELHKAVLSRMFGDAMREPFNLKDNPCRYAIIPKTAKKEPKHIDFYTVEQCKKLLEVTKGTILHDMIYITFMLGLRRSELMGLKWTAVDFERKTITINHTVVVHDCVVEKDSTKNTSSNRVYPLTDEMLSVFAGLKARRDENERLFGSCYEDSGYVFAKEDGTAYYPAYPYHMLMKVIKKNDLPKIRWHDLRHSCASMLMEKGWSMKDISDWLGHSDIGTTMNIYTHLDMTHKRKMVEGLNGMLD